MRSLLPTLLLAAACAHAPAPPPDDLAATLASIAARSDARVSISVLHLGTGQRASVHGEARLPMMSVFKLPLAVVALARVDAGALRLDQPIPLTESDLREGPSPIAEAWRAGQRAPTLEALLTHVLQDSDNTAGDKLVALAGGGAAVTAELRRLGLAGIDIAEPEIDIAARLDCPGAPRPPGGWTPAAMQACPRPSPAVRQAAAAQEIAAPPNGASADALVALLAALDRGALLSDASRAWLHAALAGVTTGANRLRAGVPAGARVEHKTGTGETVDGLNIATNDVGLITLPDGQRFAIAVLTAGARRDEAAREALLAEVSRAAWAAFAR
jgi:beta-lactamase class A